MKVCIRLSDNVQSL